MSQNTDELGDLLREFYLIYGVPNEGPPAEFNVGSMIGICSPPPRELELLRQAIEDQVLQRQFVQCRGVLDELATRLTGEELLRELSESGSVPERDFDALSDGVFWYSLASSLDQRQQRFPEMPFGGQAAFPPALRIRMIVVGSLVLRLYVALVYMREGMLSGLIAQGAHAGKPCCGRVRKLLNLDYVRRIRNALSHGTFSSCIGGIAFRDDAGVIVATPGFMNWLCTWLNLIQLQVTAASARGTGKPGG